MLRTMKLWAAVAVAVALMTAPGCMTPEQGRAMQDRVAAQADAKLTAIQDQIARHEAAIQRARAVVAGAAQAAEPLSQEVAAALLVAEDYLARAPELIEALEQDKVSVEAWRLEQNEKITDQMSKAESTWAVLAGLAGLASILIGGGGVRWGLSRGAQTVATTIAKARSVDPDFNAAFVDDGSHGVDVMKKALAMAPAAVAKAVKKANSEYPPAAVPIPTPVAYVDPESLDPAFVAGAASSSS